MVENNNNNNNNNLSILNLENIYEIKDFTRINHEFIFSKDDNIILDEASNFKFYVDNKHLYKIQRNLNLEDEIKILQNNNVDLSKESSTLKFIGYLVSGDYEYLNSIMYNNSNNNQNRNKKGSLDSIQTMFVKALQMLADELGINFSDDILPIKLYIIGQAALEYWNDSENNLNNITFDINVLKTEQYNLFQIKAFQDIIYLMDKKIHNIYDYNNDEIIINNDSKMYDFPFEISFTKEIIDENNIILYIGDEEGVILNKVYACFESILSGTSARYKDLDFSKNWLSRMNIYNKEELFNKYPIFFDIVEINSTWENIFE